MTSKIRNTASALDHDTGKALLVLDSVHAKHNVTQRDLANEAGVALGLINAYLKRCVKKGFIKVKQIPANRYSYYLTPTGFAEKSRLTAQYLTQSFSLFRVARDNFDEIFNDLSEQSLLNIALYGAGELSEIALVCQFDTDVTIKAVIDPDNEKTSFMGLQVVNSPSEVEGLDAVVICDLTRSQTVYNSLIEIFPEERVFAPKLLRISKTRAPAPE